MRPLALIGGGGFAKEVVEIGRANGFSIEDYYASHPGGLNLKHRGYLEELLENRSIYGGVALAVGAINRSTVNARRELISWLDRHGFETPALISPHAIVAKSAKVGTGSYIAHAVVLAEDSVVGRFGLINTNALVGHDAVLGENVTVSSLCFIGGGATVGNHSLIGATARVLQGARIGNDALIGFGCTVLRKVNDHQTILPSLR